MEVAWKVTVIGLILKLLCQCLCQGVVNRACFRSGSDWIDSETALPVLVSMYVVNGSCLGVDTD